MAVQAEDGEVTADQVALVTEWTPVKKSPPADRADVQAARWAFFVRAAPQTGVAREPQLLQPGGRTGPAEAPGSAAAQSARMQLCGGVTQTP